jgi:hypothetical protein
VASGQWWALLHLRCVAGVDAWALLTIRVFEPRTGGHEGCLVPFLPGSDALKKLLQSPKQFEHNIPMSHSKMPLMIMSQDGSWALPDLGPLAEPVGFPDHCEIACCTRTELAVSGFFFAVPVSSGKGLSEYADAVSFANKLLHGQPADDQLVLVRVRASPADVYDPVKDPAKVPRFPAFRAKSFPGALAVTRAEVVLGDLLLMEHMGATHVADVKQTFTASGRALAPEPHKPRALPAAQPKPAGPRAGPLPPARAPAPAAHLKGPPAATPPKPTDPAPTSAPAAHPRVPPAAPAPLKSQVAPVPKKASFAGVVGGLPPAGPEISKLQQLLRAQEVVAQRQLEYVQARLELAHVQDSLELADTEGGLFE